MNLKTTLRITPITDNCRVEFQYLYVWYEPYDVVDASYLVFGKNRENSLRSLEDFVYKLWYINPETSYIDIVSYVIEILNKKSSGGIYITESDISNVVFKIMNSNLPKDISDVVMSKHTSKGRVRTTKIVEWKSNINGLLVVGSKRMTEIRKSDNVSLELSKEYKKIKLRYMKKCIDKVNENGFQDMIEQSIDLLRETQSEASVNQISKTCGLSYTTTKKYIDLMAERLDFVEGFRVIKDKNKEMSEDTISKLMDTKKIIINNKVKFNKTNLSKYSGVSRPTVDKYWGILNV